MNTVLEKLNLDSETDPSLAISELCAAFDEECRLRKIAEADLEWFTGEVAVRLGSSNMLRSPAGLLRKLDAILSSEKVNIA